MTGLALLSHDVMSTYAELDTALARLQAAHGAQIDTSHLSQMSLYLGRLLTECSTAIYGTKSPCELSPATVPVQSIIHKICQRVRVPIESQGREFIVEGITDLPATAVIERLPLERCLGNLLSNSLRHGSGRIYLRCKKDPTQEHILQISVEDDGLGVPQSVLNGLNHPLPTGQLRSQSNAGLGLHAAMLAARNLGGDLQFSKHKNQRVTAIATFPYCLAARQNSTVALSHDPYRLRGKTGLIIEDSDALSLHVKTILEKAQASIHAVSTAEEAIKILDERPFDFIVLDIGLPKKSGLQLLEHLDQSRHGFPAIVTLSGHQDPTVIARLYQHGVSVALKKPLADPDELLNAVLHALRQKSPIETTPDRGQYHPLLQVIASFSPSQKHDFLTKLDRDLKKNIILARAHAVSTQTPQHFSETARALHNLTGLLATVGDIEAQAQVNALLARLPETKLIEIIAILTNLDQSIDDICIYILTLLNSEAI